MVCGNATSVCGWTELLDANLIGASFAMYDAAFLGYTVAILYFVYMILLWYKTQSPTLGFVMGLLFLGLYATSTLVRGTTVWVMVFMLAIELGIILYILLFK